MNTECEAFEAWADRVTPAGSPRPIRDAEIAWYAWQARAALAEKPALSDQQRVDAERYRWLRDFAAASIYVSQPFLCGAGDLVLSGADADSAVDAAILAAQEGTKP